MAQSNLSTLIDQFGDLKAEMADLELRQKALKEAFAELPKGAYEGERYRLNVIEADVERIDWKMIITKQQRVLEEALERETAGEKIIWKQVAMKLNPSRQLIAAHTAVSLVRTLRSGTRNGKKVAA